MTCGEKRIVRTSRKHTQPFGVIGGGWGGVGEDGGWAKENGRVGADDDSPLSVPSAHARGQAGGVRH